MPASYTNEGRSDWLPRCEVALYGKWPVSKSHLSPTLQGEQKRWLKKNASFTSADAESRLLTSNASPRCATELSPSSVAEKTLSTLLKTTFTLPNLKFLTTTLRVTTREYTRTRTLSTRRTHLSQTPNLGPRPRVRSETLSTFHVHDLTTHLCRPMRTATRQPVTTRTSK